MVMTLVRPGPKTTQDDVKDGIIRLLRDHPNGLNFNEIFRRLKSQKVLGSYSVLSRGMKDLGESRIVSYRDLERPRYKIPKRLYVLTPNTQSILERFRPKHGEPYLDVKTAEQDSGKLTTDLFMDIKEPSEAAFLSVLLSYARGFAGVYKQIIEEKGNPEGLWRFLLRDFLNSERRYLETRAEWVRSRKVHVKRKEELDHVGRVLWEWGKILTIYGIELKKR